MKDSTCSRHYLVVMMLPFAVVVALAVLASDADDPGEIRSVLRRFNEGVRKQSVQPLRRLFTETVDYRDCTRTLNGPDAIIALFTDREVWTERTHPMLEEQGIRFVGRSVAFVDANLVQYGSTIVKSSISVVLLLEEDAGVWRISAWRMPNCAI